jgi:uncharacterized protein YndB with AHSA1/START domain
MLIMLRIFRVVGIGVAMVNMNLGNLFAEAAIEESKTKDAMIIETEREFEYAAEAVYEAWVSEETVVAPVTRIEKDVRVGGHYRLFVEMENFTGVMDAEYQEIEPGRKLVYTWEWNNDGEETVVTVYFIPRGDGCLVKLTHGTFEKQDSFDRHAFGWGNYFDGLEKQLGGES